MHHQTKNVLRQTKNCLVWKNIIMFLVQLESYFASIAFRNNFMKIIFYPNVEMHFIVVNYEFFVILLCVPLYVQRANWHQWVW